MMEALEPGSVGVRVCRDYGFVGITGIVGFRSRIIRFFWVERLFLESTFQGLERVRIPSTLVIRAVSDPGENSSQNQNTAKTRIRELQVLFRSGPITLTRAHGGYPTAADIANKGWLAAGGLIPMC